MIIINSKRCPSYQTLPNPHPFSTGYSSRKQYDSIKQLQNQEQISIIQWVKENYYQNYTHCRNVHKIQDLFDGIALAQIVSSFLSDDAQKEDFLNQIELVQKLQTKTDFDTVINNLNLVIEVVKEMFSLVYANSQSLVKKNKNNVNLVKLVQISIKSLQNFNGQNLVSSKNKMKNFMMQIIMILPEISIALKEPNISKAQNVQKQNIKPLITENNSKRTRKSSQTQYRTQAKSNHHVHLNQYQSSTEIYNNIEQLSSIIGYSTVHNNQKKQFMNIHLYPIKQTDHKMKKMSLKKVQYPQPQYDELTQNQNIYLNQTQFQANENEKQFQNKVQKLLSWIQMTYKIDINQLIQPHLLLGELVNSILAPNRLKDNEKPIKPTHYQLGSYSVYKKCLDLLTQIQRLNKSNLITLMKQVEAGKVNQTTYWNLIEDIHLMVKNKVSEPMTSRRISKPKSVKKITQQSQKIPTEYDENFNIDNIRNQSVTELLKQRQDPYTKLNRIKDHPLYTEQVIRQTQLWLQNQMGMGHPLNKSKPSAKGTLFDSPLLNGTLFAKIIQRLKIGSAKGVLLPQDKKQLKNNMQIVKTEFLNRGYQAVRKLDIYKPSYNFYIGFLSQIRQIHLNKKSNTRKLILDDKQKRQMEQSQTEIPIPQRQELQNWLLHQYSETVQQVNGIKQLSLKQMKVVIQSIVKVNFLKETTQKIRLLNYVKLLDFFRSIGFSHYSLVKAEDIVSQNMLNAKKIQKIRWMILRDLRIIKGN